jgi:translation initiation factor 2B subunit (eIF-2B alpha/beta/delta family)
VETAALRKLLDEVARDERSGATHLVLVAAEALREWGQGGPDPRAAVLADLIERLASLRPSMAPFLNLADAVAGAAARTRAGARRAAAGDAAAQFGRRVAASPRRIAAHVARAKLGETNLATYSAGASVKAAILAVHHAGRRLQVVVSEARPALEGRALAEDLARAGVPVRLTTDAALAGQLEGVAALWLGADALTPGGLVHKVGTAGLAREARRLGVTVRVLAGRAKWVGPALAARLRLEAGDPAAVAPRGVPGLEIVNPLFDVTPWDLLDSVISEDGLVPASRARRFLEGLPASGALAGPV